MLSLFCELEHNNGYEVIKAVLKYLLERGEMNKTSFLKRMSVSNIAEVTSLSEEEVQAETEKIQ